MGCRDEVQALVWQESPCPGTSELGWDGVGV